MTGPPKHFVFNLRHHASPIALILKKPGSERAIQVKGRMPSVIQIFRTTLYPSQCLPNVHNCTRACSRLYYDRLDDLDPWLPPVSLASHVSISAGDIPTNLLADRFRLAQNRCFCFVPLNCLAGSQRFYPLMRFLGIICSCAAYCAFFSWPQHLSGETRIPDFNQFLHMAGTAEQCEPIVGTECRVGLSRFPAGIRLGVYHPTDISKMQRISDHMHAVADLLRVRVDLDISIDNANPNILLVSTDKETLDDLASLNDPLLSENQLRELDTDLFSQGACAAISYFYYTNNEFDEILSAFIFISEKNSDFELQRCVAEEIVNSIGLFNDPQGHASLFDHPLHSVSPNQYVNNITLGYLEYLYSADAVSLDTWNAFWNSRDID